MPPISFFPSCPDFLSSFAIPTDLLRMIGENFYTTVKLYAHSISVLRRPSSSQSSFQHHLEFLKRTGTIIRIWVQSSCPLSSRFIFVLALFQPIALGQFASVTRNALAAGNNKAIGTRQRGPDYLGAWKRLGSMRLMGTMTKYAHAQLNPCPRIESKMPD